MTNDYLKDIEGKIIVNICPCKSTPAPAKHFIQASTNQPSSSVRNAVSLHSFPFRDYLNTSIAPPIPDDARLWSAKLGSFSFSFLITALKGLTQTIFRLYTLHRIAFRNSTFCDPPGAASLCHNRSCVWTEVLSVWLRRTIIFKEVCK